jgi:hypothetical protein
MKTIFTTYELMKTCFGARYNCPQTLHWRDLVRWNIDKMNMQLYRHTSRNVNWNTRKCVCAVFNNPVNSWDYIASVIEEWMIVVNWWHDGKNRRTRRNHCSFLIFTPKIPLALACDWTRTPVVQGRRNASALFQTVWPDYLFQGNTIRATTTKKNNPNAVF